MEVYKILPKVRGDAQRAEGSVEMGSIPISFAFFIVTLSHVTKLRKACPLAGVSSPPPPARESLGAHFRAFLDRCPDRPPRPWRVP